MYIQLRSYKFKFLGKLIVFNVVWFNEPLRNLQIYFPIYISVSPKRVIWVFSFICIQLVSRSHYLVWFRFCSSHIFYRSVNGFQSEFSSEPLLSLLRLEKMTTQHIHKPSKSSYVIPHYHLEENSYEWGVLLRERVSNDQKNFHLLVLNSSSTWVLFTLWEPFWLNWLVPPRRHIIYPRLTSLFLTFSGFPSFSLLLYRKQALSLPCFSLCCFVTNPSTSISVFSIIQSNGNWRYESPEENESKDSTKKRKHKSQDFWDLGEESNGGSISCRAGKKERRWHWKLRVESVDKPSLCRRLQWEVSDLWPGWWCLNTNN